MAKNQEYPVLITIRAKIKARSLKQAQLLWRSLELSVLHGLPREPWCSDVTVEGKIEDGEA